MIILRSHLYTDIMKFKTLNFYRFYRVDYLGYSPIFFMPSVF